MATRRRRSDRFTEEEILAEIRRVSSIFPACTFKDFRLNAKIAVTTVLRRFKRFDLAKLAAGVALTYRVGFPRREENAPSHRGPSPRRAYIHSKSIVPEYDETPRDRSATILCLGDCGKMFFSQDKYGIRFCDFCKRFRKWED